MRALPVELCILAFWSLSAVQPALSIEPIKARSKDDLYVKCRHAIFRRYGSPAISYSTGRPGYRALPHQFVIGAIDRCVASGGHVD
jgi:hypothetical protein